jgi:hypothetical protein
MSHWQNMPGEGRREVKTGSEGPKGYTKAAFIMCGQRIIAIQLNQSDAHGASVLLEERLEAPKN